MNSGALFTIQDLIPSQLPVAFYKKCNHHTRWESRRLGQNLRCKTGNQCLSTCRRNAQGKDASGRTLSGIHAALSFPSTPAVEETRHRVSWSERPPWAIRFSFPSGKSNNWTPPRDQPISPCPRFSDFLSLIMFFVKYRCDILCQLFSLEMAGW